MSRYIIIERDTAGLPNWVLSNPETGEVCIFTDPETVYNECEQCQGSIVIDIDSNKIVDHVELVNIPYLTNTIQASDGTIHSKPFIELEDNDEQSSN